MGTVRLPKILVLTIDDSLSAQWERQLLSVATRSGSKSRLQRWEAHAQWWARFWQRSRVRLSGHLANPSANATQITQANAAHRYLSACAMRKHLIKFNGGE